MENLFWKFFLPNWSWARQPLSSARSTLLYPFQMLSAKQGSSNFHLLTSFGMTRPGIEPTTSRLWGGRSTDWANTHRYMYCFWIICICFGVEFPFKHPGTPIPTISMPFWIFGHFFSFYTKINYSNDLIILQKVEIISFVFLCFYIIFCQKYK